MTGFVLIGKPEVCPKSKKQRGTCRSINTNCLNPEAVKPSETKNCEYVLPIIIPPITLLPKENDLLSVIRDIILIIGTIFDSITAYLLYKSNKKKSRKNKKDVR